MVGRDDLGKAITMKSSLCEVTIEGRCEYCKRLQRIEAEKDRTKIEMRGVSWRCMDVRNHLKSY